MTEFIVFQLITIFKVYKKLFLHFNQGLINPVEIMVGPWAKIE